MLHDEGILFGKLIAAVGYGWGITLACLLAGIATVNLRYRGGGLLIYSTEVGFGIVTLLSVGSLAVAMARFKRARLILD